ncbi:hypothetical protein Tco_1069293 [Tanacetum coccineum]|uniref:Uncharacterized protein n=1 Tax=Tanacetum coccineum TaxID=301880 RepID=A0ABQ5HIB6_9ASTR
MGHPHILILISIIAYGVNSQEKYGAKQVLPVLLLAGRKFILVSAVTQGVKNIKGMFVCQNLKTLGETIELANTWMDQKLSSLRRKQSLTTKGRLMNSSRNNHRSPVATLQDAECRQVLTIWGQAKEAILGILA